jgi:anti-sigma B factor antagonist
MDISTRESGAVKIVDLNGNLDTNTAPETETHLSSLMQEDAAKILINLKNLEYISSAGLRVFLATAKQLKSSGGELRLCNLNETVQEIFDMSGFSTILSVCDQESDALSDW